MRFARDRRDEQIKRADFISSPRERIALIASHLPRRASRRYLWCLLQMRGNGTAAFGPSRPCLKNSCPQRRRKRTNPNRR